MATYLVQGNTTLYRMTHAGVATALTLPSGFTLTGSATPARFATLGKYTIVVNGSPQGDIVVAPNGTLYPLQITPPMSPTPVAVSGSITGSYKAKVSHRIYDTATGELILESGLSAESVALSLSAQGLGLSGVSVSSHSAVNARGLYKTAAGGSVFYPWAELGGNEVTDYGSSSTTVRGVLGSVTDATLSLVGAPRLGTPPTLKLIASWRDRLFGVPRDASDELWWSEEKVFYAWPKVNSIVVPPKESDVYGVTALVPRQDSLGIGRRNGCYHFSGTGNDSFENDRISDIGIVSQESVVVVRDVAYFLGTHNGRYMFCEWDNEGVRPISVIQVDAWLNSVDDTGADTYFNRSSFSLSKARYNVERDQVEWLLPATGQSTLNRWVSFNLTDRIWTGPHKTDAYTPACSVQDALMGGILTTTNDKKVSVWGTSDGYLYKNDPSSFNDHTTAIDFNVTTPFFHGGDPDLEYVWLGPTTHVREQSSGVLSITPRVGSLSAAAKLALYHPLTVGRKRHSRLGRGRYVQFNFRHQTASEGCSIYGLQVPHHVRGRR